MKRDMGIIRRIALAVADLPAGEELFELPAIDAITFSEHVRWMMEAGLVNGYIRIEGGRKIADGETKVWRLTWKGCDFLDTVLL